MRATILILSCSLSSAALAGTITDTVSYSGSATNGSQVSGPLFDPSLGTLTGISLAVTGFYTPDIVFPRNKPA